MENGKEASLVWTVHERPESDRRDIKTDSALATAAECSRMLETFGFSQTKEECLCFNNGTFRFGPFS